MKYFISIISMLSLLACSSKNDNKNNYDTTADVSSKKTIMKSESLYPDSLTPIQKKCVEKAKSFLFDPKYADVPYSVWEADDYMTDEEKDAIAELSIWDWSKKYKPIEDSAFRNRFLEIFGYDFDKFSNFTNSKECLFPIDGKKLNENLLQLSPTNPHKDFYVSKKIKMIIDGFDFGIDFDNSYDINTFIPTSRFETGVQLGTPDKPNNVPSLDYLFHLNNYLFNEANVSRTWLIIKDPYFMAHLLIEYGYDGDNEINKMVLKKMKEEDDEIIDIPVDPFHIYPDGKVKILDGLLTTAAELSTAECADYFAWATSMVDLLGGVDDSKDKVWRIKHLTISQRREILAHIVDYMLPIYHKFLETNYKYGTIDVDFGDLRIIDCFWNSLMQDHELISEIEKNGYYGLSNLQSQVEAIKDFKPFYNEESGVFEPWNYIPMRYRNSDEE